MDDTKLYGALSTLNIYELNRFHKYLMSPYFNKNLNMISLFEALETSLRNEKVVVSGKENVWETMLLDTPFDDRKFRKFCSDLLKLLEGFLVQEAFEKNPLHQASYLLAAVGQKKVEKLYKSSIRTAKRLSQMQQLRPASYYFFQYEFERGYYNIVEYEINRSEISNIESIAANLDRFYLAEKLRYYCTILSRKKILKHDYEMLFIDEIINHVETHDYSNVPPIKIYHQILKMNLEPKERSHYDQLRELISQNILMFPEQEAKEIIDSALNYSIRQINTGKAEFLREIFELYQEALHKELLYVNQELSPWSFKNIVITALRLKEFDWTELFIKEYSSRLQSKYRDNAVTFNMAQLYFYKGEYTEVIRLLQQVEYDDLSYSLNSKAFLMGSYYELDEIEAMHSLLDSFRVYLNRNKSIPESRRRHYLNMIKIVKKMSKIRPGDDKSIEKLHREIEEVKEIASKSWIMEKMAQLSA